MKTLSMMRMTVIAGCLSAAVFAPAASAEVKLVGSGASFPFPIYSKWFKDFSAKHRGIRVDYQSKGSGAGIQDFINHTVDFVLALALLVGSTSGAQIGAKISKRLKADQLKIMMAGIIIVVMVIMAVGLVVRPATLLAYKGGH